MKWVKWILEILLGAGLLVWAVLLIVRTEPTRTSSATEKPLQVVYVEKVSFVPLADTLIRQGTASAQESVDITAQVSEKVVRINFDDGQPVRLGDVLVELDNTRELAAMQVAELAVAEHQREQERLTRLLKGDAIAQKDLDDRETRLAMARADKLRAEADLAYRVIKAPFAGVLGRRLVSLGDLVSPGMLITTLDDVDQVYIDFSAPEKYTAKLSPGLTFTAGNDAYPGETFEGTIKMIEPRVNVLSRSAQVRGTLKNPDHRIRPGMLLNVSLSMGVEEVTVVPEMALVSLGERQYLFVLPEGSDRVTKVEVKIGRRVGRWAEVTSGIERGAVIVTDGISKITEGQQVKVEARPERRAAHEEKAE